MMFPENQEEVSRKITDWRDGIVERFGTSQVPTPSLNEFYKQVGDVRGSAASQKQDAEIASAQEPIKAETVHAPVPQQEPANEQ